MRIQQVAPLKSTERAERVFDPPAAVFCLKESVQSRRRHAPFDLMRGVPPAAGAGDCVVGDIGAQDVDVPLSDIGQHFRQQDANAVRLLPGAARGGPDAESLGKRRSRFAIDRFRNNLVLQGLKGRVVAEKERLVGRDRVDDFAANRGIELASRAESKLSV